MKTEINFTYRFPEEIKDLISTLKDEKQWQILELLMNANESLPYTEIRTKMGLPVSAKGVLNYHLKELERSGWIRNWVKRGNLLDKYNSYYSISDFGMKVIEGLIKATVRSSYSTNSFQNVKKFLGQSNTISADPLSSSFSSGGWVTGTRWINRGRMVRISLRKKVPNQNSIAIIDPSELAPALGNMV